MAILCARCGTQNPDGNSFCQACGTPLAAPTAPTAPVGPPAGPPAQFIGPPPDLPPPSISPYYAPSAGAPQAPVHRAPWALIISAVVGLLVVMVGCGAGLAILTKSSNPTTTSAFLPSPSPAGSPSPVPSASPVALGCSGSTASTSSESVTVPSGWLPSCSGDTITLTDPSGYPIAIFAAVDSPPATAQQLKDAFDLEVKTRYPDAAPCPNTKTTAGSVAGVSGIWWQMCFTNTQGQSFQGEFAIFAGANADGSVGYGVILFAPAAYMNTFLNEAKPVIASIRWKLK